MIVILAVLLPFSLALHIDYAPAIVSDTIIESTPADNAIALQNALGPLSFPFALFGGIMLTAMIGFLVGPAYWLFKRNSTAWAIVVASILLPLLIWIAFPIHMTLFALIPLAAIGPLLTLITRRDPPLSRDPSGESLSRRAILIRAAIFSLGGLALSVIDGLPAYQFALNAAKAGAKLFDFTPPAPRVSSFPAPGDVAEVTNVADFYVMRKFPNAVPPALPDWKLTVDGVVAQPLALSLADIQAFPRTDIFLTRECVSNPVGGKLISTALMSGVRLADVLQKVGVKPEAVQFVFYGRDGYAESVPVDHALSNGLLTYAMNGLLLPDAHGAPLKVEIPGLYGFKSMKWLTRIEAVATPYQSVWTQAGWTSSAIVKTMSRIDAITPDADGAIISGVAFAGLREISRVEVQINGGGWQAATLNIPPLSNKTWVQWRLNTSAQGDLTVVVRAIDGTGISQISDKHSQFPDGASGLHTIAIHV
ncbi:MAG: molybdopterin-dependent oxidoreductase [Aggregatilineales bacterium]